MDEAVWESRLGKVERMIDDHDHILKGGWDNTGDYPKRVPGMVESFEIAQKTAEENRRILKGIFISVATGVLIEVFKLVAEAKILH
jgi:hypothetical protein